MLREAAQLCRSNRPTRQAESIANFEYTPTRRGEGGRGGMWAFLYFCILTLLPLCLLSFCLTSILLPTYLFGVFLCFVVCVYVRFCFVFSLFRLQHVGLCFGYFVSFGFLCFCFVFVVPVCSYLGWYALVPCVCPSIHHVILLLPLFSAFD